MKLVNWICLNRFLFLIFGSKSFSQEMKLKHWQELLSIINQECLFDIMKVS